MSKKNENIKETITNMVLATSINQRGKKSGGVKIATRNIDLPITVIAPFSK